MNAKHANTKEDIDKRTIRAATESIRIDRHAGEAGEFDVNSEIGNVYRVYLIAEACDCPSDTYQDGVCKHQRRVELMIATHEQYRGLGDSTVKHRPADDAMVVTDGGITTETAMDADINKPVITGPWTEPAEQGGTDYWRCEDCGRESLRRSDLERSKFHAEECVFDEAKTVGRNWWPC
ncbi:hypothetical protein [Halalkalicoccus subterraneus]|uniref:hypothetical protein n=1 Tax=Halalkalicoccus subterraneus TaxID=2675002 RepID=UPI000EFB0376|nr:hypothetical protein [Halalkalicoccus subterraneus]